MAKKSAGGTPATVALTRAGITFTLHEYAHDPRATSYGSEAAEALGLDPDRVFKTLLAEVDGHLVVAVVPVVDESATAYDVVYVSAGRRGLDLGIAPADLVAVTGAITADVSRS